MGEKYSRLVKWLKPGSSILDTGCGSGRDTVALEKLGFKVTAVDGSFGMAREAENIVGRGVLVIKHQDIKFEKQFDGIWASATFLHVPRDEQGLVWANYIRALKPGGLMMASYKIGETDGFDAQERWFTNVTMETLEAFVKQIPGVELVSLERDGSDLPRAEWVIAVVRRLA